MAFETFLRVDTPPKIRKRAQRRQEGVYSLIVTVAMLAMLGGLGGGLLLLWGGFRFTDYLGALLLGFWIAGWWRVLAAAVAAGDSTKPWYIEPRVGGVVVYLAHEQYEKLSPETQDTYGRDLVTRVYELSQTDVRGRTAQRNVENRMHDRVRALTGLVDAEDKQRMYAADPALAPRDDIDAAKLWQRAVAEADKYLREL